MANCYTFLLSTRRHVICYSDDGHQEQCKQNYVIIHWAHFQPTKWFKLYYNYLYHSDSLDHVIFQWWCSLRRQRWEMCTILWIRSRQLLMTTLHWHIHLHNLHIILDVKMQILRTNLWYVFIKKLLKNWGVEKYTDA